MHVSMSDLPLPQLLWKVFLLLLLFVVASDSDAKTVITAHYLPKTNQAYTLYHRQLLILALEKTESSHGPFEIVEAPNFKTRKRAVKTLLDNKIPNLIYPLIHRNEVANDKRLSYVEFPIFLGILGTRVCFTSTQKEQSIAQVKSLKDLQYFTHIQGLQWSDVDILRHNGFKVYENASTTPFITLLSNGRADLFCRGINEIEKESQLYSNIENIRVDKSFALEYPMIKFFYGNRNSSAVLQRIEKGLIKAYKDGSFMEYFNMTFKQSIDFVDMEKRKRYSLENPTMKGLDRTYEKYLYNTTDFYPPKAQ